jgi:hypothetical protein
VASGTEKREGGGGLGAETGASGPAPMMARYIHLSNCGMNSATVCAQDPNETQKCFTADQYCPVNDLRIRHKINHYKRLR